MLFLVGIILIANQVVIASTWYLCSCLDMLGQNNFED
jgi:hypothetical protein